MESVLFRPAKKERPPLQKQLQPLKNCNKVSPETDAVEKAKMERLPRVQMQATGINNDAVAETDLNTGLKDRQKVDEAPELPECSPSDFTYAYKKRVKTFTECSLDRSVGCFRTSSKVEPRESILVMKNVFKDIWPERDILNEEEIQYLRNVELAFEDDATTMKKELLTVSRFGYTNRLTALYDFLSKKDENLCLAKNQYLGKLGETALHVSLLFGNIECAKFLVENATKALLLHQYACKAYQGTTVLHLAVVNGDIDIITALMERLEPDERVELLKKRSTGNFFCEKFAPRELALSLSVWRGRLDTFDTLMRYNADINACERITGNNIIHSIVNFSQHDPDFACVVFTEVLQRASYSTWRQRMDMPNTDTQTKDVTLSHTIKARQKILGKKNKAGLTPLALAAKKASGKIFDTIINTEDVYRFSQWRYGPVEYNYYDMTEIDPSVCISGSHSVLELLIFSSGKSSKLADIFNKDPIAELIRVKMKQTLPHVICYAFVHLISMSIMLSTSSHLLGSLQSLSNSSMNTTNTTNTSNATQPYHLPINDTIAETFDTPSDILLWIGRIWVFLMAWVYLIVNVVDLKWSPWFVIKPMMPMIVLEFAFSFSTTIWFAFTIWLKEQEDIALSIASLIGFTLMLCIIRGIHMFFVIFQRLLLIDFPRFFISFTYILIGFTVAFSFIFKETRVDKIPPEVDGLFTTMLTLFRLLTGLADFEFIEQSRYPWYCTILYLLFVLVFNLVLLNMLIALFSATYSQVAEKEDFYHLKDNAALNLMLERRFGRFFKRQIGFERGFVNEDDKLKLKWFLPIKEVNFEEIKD